MRQHPLKIHNIPERTLAVLIVDDDQVDRMALRRALIAAGLDVVISEAFEADAAIQSIESKEYDCIFLDYNLPGKNGLTLVRQIRQQGIKTPLIVLTGQGDEQTAVALMKAGASDYLPKSKLSAETISRLVRSAILVYQAELIIEQANQRTRDKNQLLEQQNRELARQRQQIHQQNLQLQEVSRLKSEFLATMSHELRTPLNAIIGFSQILLNRSNNPLSQVQRDMLDRVLANGRNLLELINDILAFSKIEAGRLALEPESIDLAQLVNQTSEELRSLADRKALQLQVDIDLSNPQIVNDAARLREVLVNLISNAIKFTERGFVLMLVTDSLPDELPEHDLAEDNLAKDKILISVTDTGCGISAHEQTHIFEPFRQADQKVTRKHSGTGLGLAITYSLIKMMQGEITLDSEVDQGSTFKVEIPREVRCDNAASIANPAATSAYKR
jgi:signal transduction histidine kinase